MAAVEGILSALERNWEMVDGTLAGLDDAILARRPTDQCNSIAWLLWHMTRVLSTWTEILVCFKQGSPVGIAWDGSGKMYKNICPYT